MTIRTRSTLSFRAAAVVVIHEMLAELYAGALRRGGHDVDVVTDDFESWPDPARWVGVDVRPHVPRTFAR